MSFVYYVFFMGLISLVLVRSHILLSLMSLEFVILSLMLMVFITICDSMIMYFYVFIMSFYVCESVLGLTILVMLIRNHGNDYLNSMFMW